MYLTATDPVIVSEDTTIDNDGDSKVYKLKIGTKVAKSKSQDKSKDKNWVKALTKSSGSDFLTPGARKTFTKQRQAVIKTPILHHYDPNCHIQIEIDALPVLLAESSVS